MTNKSIDPKLQTLIAAGKLVLFKPTMDVDQTARRLLYVRRGLHDQIMGSYKKAAERTYFSKIRAVFGEFITTPFIKPDTFLKPLAYDYKDPSLRFIWELKVLLAPQSRVFGRFFEKNAMVVLSDSFREECDFQAHMVKTRDRWNELLLSHPGVRSNVYDDCVD